MGTIVEQRGESEVAWTLLAGGILFAIRIRNRPFLVLKPRQLLMVAAAIEGSPQAFEKDEGSCAAADRTDLLTFSP